MYIYDTNFLNMPAIRFKKPSLETLDKFYDEVYHQFKTKEDLGEAWKEDCFDALIKEDDEKLKLLQRECGKICFTDDLIDVLIDNFTRVDSDVDVEYYTELILRNKKYIKSLEIKNEPKQLVFETTFGKFKATKLSDAFPLFKKFPDIETSERHGRCHNDAIVVATTIQDDCKVATGYCYTFGEGDKFLHSWVEVKLDGRDFVVDTTRNLLMPKKGFYCIRNIKGPVYKISKQTLQKEEKIHRTLYNENEWLIKLYLANRKQALQIYQLIQQKQEKEKLEDPLYVAAKHMHDSFVAAEKKRKKSKDKTMLEK